MAAEISNSEKTEAITVPYPAFHSATRSNCGFVDIRGRADLAAQIPECLNSANLKGFLMRLAASEAPLFSVGCDLGSHTDLALEKHRREIAGGYVQVVSSWYSKIAPQDWASLFNSVGDAIENQSASDDWTVHFELAPIKVNLDGFNGLTGSVTTNFFAHAPSRQKALNSRERLIGVLDVALSDDRIMEAFKGRNF
ncbi:MULTISPECIES: hypothetical protein [unclassified Mesorhizobium]|uniref:hypothetical protein n=1 Tax=unclassified Mesorhizobium TaxID=325217 RepID=UPI00333B23A5